MPGRTLRPISRFLDTNGDKTGSTNGAVDASIVPIELFAQPPVGDDFTVTQITVTITAMSVGVLPEGYGALAAVTNGVIAGVADESEDILIIGGPYKTNMDYLRVSRMSRPFDIETDVGNRSRPVVFKFLSPAPTESIQINGSARQRFFVRLSDDFSGYTEHSFYVIGEESGTF